MAAEEQILVIETKIFEELGMFHGLMFDVDKYLERIFCAGVPRFMPRSQAEKDPSFKQLIPYVIMNCQGKYLNYVRGSRAGEKRLVGNRSIGIGGHINPIDDMSLLGIYETYKTAVDREVAEEVNVETNHTDKIAALLNDDSNEVGQVHLGIVHYWTLDEPKVGKNEQMITQVSFMTIEELRQVRDSMETWSQLCLDGLSKMSESI
ncbi:MAG: NUDIX domain-containing protein [Sedimentisphaerales bacterium]|nr:NUDIX domain-containing protein [Sedimentisphaerales bacterium]